MNTLPAQSLIKPIKTCRTWPKAKRDSSQPAAAIEALEERKLFSAIAATIMPAMPLPKPFDHPHIAIIAILIG